MKSGKNKKNQSLHYNKEYPVKRKRFTAQEKKWQFVNAKRNFPGGKNGIRKTTAYKKMVYT